VRGINKPPMSDRQLRPRPPRARSSSLSSSPPSDCGEHDSPAPHPSAGKKPSTPHQPPAKKTRITKSHSPAPPDPLVGPSTHTESSATLTFHPTTPRAWHHDAHNLLPSSMRGLDAVEPIHIFRLFLTNSLLDTMSANTNAYVEKKIKEEGQSGARGWIEVSPSEIGAWIGIVLYGGAPLTSNFEAPRLRIRSFRCRQQNPTPTPTISCRVTFRMHMHHAEEYPYTFE
jgi:hypothetical protein